MSCCNTASLGGIFEVQGNNISYAGIIAYEGYSSDKFKEALRRVVPTPVPLTQSGSEARPETLAQIVARDPVIVEAELMGSDSRGSASPDVLTDTFKITKWLKKPPGFLGDTISAFDPNIGGCSQSPHSGSYLVFIFVKGGNYTDLMLNMQDSSVHYPRLLPYWGWPLHDLEAELTRLLP